MTETPVTSVSQRGSHRGRAWRGGRFRRGRPNGSSRSDSPAEGSQPTQPDLPVSNHEPAAASEIRDASQEDRQPGRGRGRGRSERGRRSGGRRGTGQRSIVVSHRGGRGPPSVPVPGGSNPSGPGFSATAPEFVPGQPVSIPSSRLVIHQSAHSLQSHTHSLTVPNNQPQLYDGDQRPLRRYCRSLQQKNCLHGSTRISTAASMSVSSAPTRCFEIPRSGPVRCAGL